MTSRISEKNIGRTDDFTILLKYLERTDDFTNFWKDYMTHRRLYDFIEIL